MRLLQIFTLLFLLGSTGYAQSVKARSDSGTVIILDGPRKIKPSPLYIIKYKNKQYVLDTTVVKKGGLNPNSIAGIDVLKGKEADSLYGLAARHGVIIIKLKEHKKSKELKALMKHSTRL